MLSKKRIIFALILVVVTGLGVFLYQVLRDKTYLRREDLISHIEQQLPNGSAVADVENFVSTYKTKFPVSIGSYQKIEPSMKNLTHVAEGPSNADGYLTARIDRTGQWSLFEVFMILTFYFDKDKKLMGSRVVALADAL